MVSDHLICHSLNHLTFQCGLQTFLLHNISYGSGGAILQREGHPCLLERDYDGAGECDEGLACYNSDGDTYGVGVCTNLAKYSKKDQVCNIDFGVNACTSNYACYSRKNGRNSQIKVGTACTGICQRVVQRSGYNEVCDVSFGANACLNEYRCLGANGREIGRLGIGFWILHPFRSYRQRQWRRGVEVRQPPMSAVVINCGG